MSLFTVMVLSQLTAPKEDDAKGNGKDNGSKGNGVASSKAPRTPVPAGLSSV
jgi:hypothetical protein